MVESHPGMSPRGWRKGRNTALPYQHEIILPFLRSNNIKPNWIDCQDVMYGFCNETTGLCEGAIGKLSNILSELLKKNVFLDSN